MQKTNKPSNSVDGVVRANPRGFGFLETESGDSYFIPAFVMKRTINGDEVRATLSVNPRTQSLQVGRVFVKRRPSSVWLGTAQMLDGKWILEPDEACTIPITIKGTHSIEPGSVVAVEYKEESSPNLNVLTVSLITDLGHRNREGFDADYAKLKFNFAAKFSHKQERAAAKASALIRANDLASVNTREDLTALPFITIDEASTKDLDDAIYAKRFSDGSFELKVAIADVAHFIKPGSQLDSIAKKRAISLYLPGGEVVPMLPSVLSQGVCSLNPGEERLVVVAHMKIDAEGNLESYEFKRAVIKSVAKLSYDEVQDWLDGKTGIVTPALKTALALYDAFEVLFEARHNKGKLEFNESSPELVLSPDGKQEVELTYRKKAHLLIEEVMVIVNYAAALKLRDLGSLGLYRNQESPNDVAIAAWNEWLAFDGNKPVEGPISIKYLVETISSYRQDGKAREASLMTRSLMSSASYDSTPKGHFSLGFDAYTHFSSPIRRYADLVVHRILLGEYSSDFNLAPISELCSDAAARARMAERYVWDRLKRKQLIKTTPRSEELSAYTVYNTRRGVRVVLTKSQCSAWLDSSWLQKMGATYNDDNGYWYLRDKPVVLGTSIDVNILKLDDAKGQMELHVKPSTL